MQETSVLEAILRRDRTVVITGLIMVIVLSWIYILLGAGMNMNAFDMSSIRLPWQEDSAMDMSGQQGDLGAMQGMGAMINKAHMAMTQPAVWTSGYATLMFFMWWVMMIAMMLPSASPMVLLFARVNRTQREKGSPFVSTGVFASGYLVVWGAFSLLATATQWGLESVGLLSGMMASTSAVFGGGVLILAGIYQLTPLKHACLKHCRSPLQFITQHWRTGTWGAFRMGIEHGGFCALCCWFLMALLYVGGVMNLYWIVGLALFVLLEKTIPAGHWLGSITGVALIAWGGWLMVGLLI